MVMLSSADFFQKYFFQTKLSGLSAVCDCGIMKYHALFVIFEKAAKFEIVVCCKI